MNVICNAGQGGTVAAMVISDLKDFWRLKELEAGRIITVQEVSKATGISWESVDRLKSGETTRFDSPVLGKICQFFGVPSGEPVPFLKVSYSDEVA